MTKKFFTAAVCLSCAFIPALASAAGGFGITPPYVRNDSLTRTSHYEQKIILVRSDPSDDLQADVTINVPRADGWISIDKGTEFIMPKGEQQVPMIVSVNVPDSAPFGDYAGNIRVVVSPLGGPEKGTVGITIGAQIDVNLNVIDKKIIDFKIRSVHLSDTEEGHTLWWMHFPGKILFDMQVENLGNVAAAPAKVVFEFRDPLTQKVLETEANSNGFPNIKPFDTQTITAEIPTYLPRGGYKVFYKIYKDDTTVINQGELDLSVLPPGSLAGYAGYGFWGLRASEKAIAFAIIFGILGIFCAGWLGVRRGLRKKKERKLARTGVPRPPQ